MMTTTVTDTVTKTCGLCDTTETATAERRPGERPTLHRPPGWAFAILYVGNPDDWKSTTPEVVDLCPEHAGRLSAALKTRAEASA